MKSRSGAYRNRSRVHRHAYPTALFWVPAFVNLALALFLLVVPPPSLWQLFSVPLNLGLAALWWRMARVGAYLDQAGIRVVRSFRTVRIPWERFYRFVLRPRGLLQKVGFVELTDGSFVWIQGLAPWFPLFRSLDRGGVDRLIAEMNREAQILSASRPSPPPLHDGGR